MIPSVLAKTGMTVSIIYKIDWYEIDHTSQHRRMAERPPAMDLIGWEQLQECSWRVSQASHGAESVH
jgi:hypothetical protein